MRTSNYSDREIELRYERVRQYMSDGHRGILLNEMVRIASIGKFPYFVISKETNKVIDGGYKWYSNDLEIYYNRLVIDLYEYEHRVYNDLF